MGLNGIDISSWQDDLVVSAMDTCDFVIVKATGGAGYTNECFRRHADETLAAGKLLGCYHYARDRGYEGSAEAEADHFISAFKPYVGNAIPFLDWEADALNLGVAWAKAWLDRVRAKTGVTPGIYTSKSVCFAYDWSRVAKTYPLWVAQYPDYEDTGFEASPGPTAGTSARGTLRCSSSTRAREGSRATPGTWTSTCSTAPRPTGRGAARWPAPLLPRRWRK